MKKKIITLFVRAKYKLNKHQKISQYIDKLSDNNDILINFNNKQINLY